MPKYVDGAGLSRFWDNIQDQIGNASQAQVDAWLNNHPEATTTVQDGSVTNAKLVQTGGVLSDVNELVQVSFTEGDGYLDIRGLPATGSNQEKYTNEIPVHGDKLSFEITYSQAKSRWVAYAEYDAEGAFLSRTVLVSSGSDTSYSAEVTPSIAAKYVRFTYRSYSESVDYSVNISMYKNSVNTNQWVSDIEIC